MKTHRSWSDRGYDRLQQLLFAAWNGQTVVLPAEHRQFRLGTPSTPPFVGDTVSFENRRSEGRCCQPWGSAPLSAAIC
jgi:hypothetical protein